MKQGLINVNSEGTCTVAPLQRVARVQREVMPMVHPNAPKQSAKDLAPWVMRFLALALVLFVGVVLALHG